MFQDAHQDMRRITLGTVTMLVSTTGVSMVNSCRVDPLSHVLQALESQLDSRDLRIHAVCM